MKRCLLFCNKILHSAVLKTTIILYDISSTVLIEGFFSEELKRMQEKGYGTLLLKKETKGVPRMKNVFCKPHFLSLSEDSVVLRIAGISHARYAERFNNMDKFSPDEVAVIRLVHPEVEDMNLSPPTQTDSDEERYRDAYQQDVPDTQIQEVSGILLGQLQDAHVYFMSSIL